MSAIIALYDRGGVIYKRSDSEPGPEEIGWRMYLGHFSNHEPMKSKSKSFGNCNVVLIKCVEAMRKDIEQENMMWPQHMAWSSTSWDGIRWRWWCHPMVSGTCRKLMFATYTMSAPNAEQVM